jgi:excinuclease ABC subunit C
MEQLDAAKRKATRSILELKEDLALDKVPILIESFDISNLGEREAVGSKITFLEGTPNKKEYRMYRIKTVSQQDDPAMMGEIIRRRFTRLSKERREPPDLVVVDGGITQVRAAKRQLDQMTLDIPVIGLAKKSEQIYMHDGRVLELDRNSTASLLLQHIRDEAHRFAVRYHRKRREEGELA